MGVRVVESYPGSASVGRFMAALLGAVLLLVAMVAAVLPVVFGLGLLLSARDSSGDSGMDGQTLAWVGGLFVLAIAVGWAAVRLIQGRRRLGLFLRRFGYGDATRTISAVVGGGLGRSWRMVTLDDSSVAPMGAARRHRFAPLLITGGALFVAVLAGWWILGGGPGDATDNTFAGAAPPHSLGEAVGTAIAAAVVVAVLLALVLIGAAIAVVVAVVAGMGLRSARLAKKQASVVIDRSDRVAAQARLIARRNRRVFSSRLVVCTVANPQWRDTVRALATVADAVVIDLSHATENVVWEVEQIRGSAAVSWVLVCHRDRLGPLLQASTAPPGSPYARLGALLDGQDVLAYGGHGGPGQFARSLRHRLDALVKARTTT